VDELECTNRPSEDNIMQNIFFLPTYWSKWSGNLFKGLSNRREGGIDVKVENRVLRIELGVRVIIVLVLKYEAI